jgi:hypothetical protein
VVEGRVWFPSLFISFSEILPCRRMGSSTTWLRLAAG